MSTKELIDEYVKEICGKCKNCNKEFKDCNITICQDNKIKEARCDCYEKTR